jgi:hypothetical protein
MDQKFSTPLAELPSYLSTISMVVDDGAAIVQKLKEAERKSPPVYGPSRELFLTILKGKLSFDRAIKQARHLTDETERKCAIQILNASRDFLRNERPQLINPVSNLSYILPNGMPLKVTPIWIRRCDPDRLLALHFWETPLTEWQLGAAAAVLRSALFDLQPQYASCEIDFISVSFSQFYPSRRFERLNWAKLKPLDESGLNRFWSRFIKAWSQYRRIGPREIKSKRQRTLFD